MTRSEAVQFAEQWAAAWNARDVELVLRMFSEDTTFVSPTALAVVGAATVRGKAALRAYWNSAMERIGSLRFTLDRVLWDETARELAIIYVAEIDGRYRRVSENLTLDLDGLVTSAEIFHGVAEK